MKTLVTAVIIGLLIWVIGKSPKKDDDHLTGAGGNA
jgi:hypothetical protein